MLEAVVFYVLAGFILGFAVLVIAARNTVHSALFLIANFLCVAVVYVVLGAEFLAVIQVLVYAGGIVVLYLFVVMLVNLKRLPEPYAHPRRGARLGLVVGGAVLAEITAILIYSAARPTAITPAAGIGSGGNTERLGLMLYTDYLIPFEVASILLLVAIIGAILLARRQAES